MMIKIEQLNGGAKATIVRNGAKQAVYVTMIITPEELKTLEVIGGSLLYTVDETEIIEVKGIVAKAPEPKAVAKPVVESTEPEAPAVVKPAIKTAKK
jgi:hypothetical protein